MIVYLVINPDDLKIAFNNCKQIKLKRLIVRNFSMGMDNNLDIALNIIKDFVKESDLEFLVYNIYSNYSNENLENLINEIQLFVKMVSYNDLVVRVSDTDGTLMIS